MNTKSCPVCDEPVAGHTMEDVLKCLQQIYGQNIPSTLETAISHAVGMLALHGFSQVPGNSEWTLTFRDETIKSSEPYLDIMRKILQFATPVTKRKKAVKESFDHALTEEERLRDMQRTSVEGQDGPLTEDMQAEEDHQKFLDTLPPSED